MIQFFRTDVVIECFSRRSQQRYIYLCSQTAPSNDIPFVCMVKYPNNATARVAWSRNLSKQSDLKNSTEFSLGEITQWLGSITKVIKNKIQ